MDNLTVLAKAIFHRDDASIGDKYGYRIHPITGLRSMHFGVDIKTKVQNWEQYAIAEGYVWSAGVDNSKEGQGAIFAWIAYPLLGFRLLHYHLKEVYVKKGEKVNANTIIGLTGTTGRSTAVHLHLGARSLRTGNYFDPATIVLQATYNDHLGVFDADFFKQVQASSGTTADGIMSGQLVLMTNITVMRKGTKGSEWVRWLQRFLNTKGFNLKVDGQFGPLTLKTWQKYVGTVADGSISRDSLFVKRVRELLAEGTLWEQ